MFLRSRLKGTENPENAILLDLDSVAELQHGYCKELNERWEALKSQLIATLTTACSQLPPLLRGPEDPDSDAQSAPPTQAQITNPRSPPPPPSRRHLLQPLRPPTPIPVPVPPHN